jgi:uncharacterized protein DUF3775
MPDLDPEITLDPDLTLDPDAAFYIVLLAQDFAAKEAAGSDPDEGSNAADDGEIDVLQDSPDDPVEAEISAAISPLNIDARLDLIALAWIGRGDFGFDEWRDARDAAREVPPASIAHYLMEMPALSDYLQDALAELGYTLDDYLERTGRGDDTAPGVAQG